VTAEKRPPRLEAVIFDLDGVVTDTAGVHAKAWKALFDGYLKERAETRGEPFEPFDSKGDYLAWVDGKPRYQGVKSFLESRGIDLPFGEPGDAPDVETVCGLGNRKNVHFQERLRLDGVKVFQTTVDLIKGLKSLGVQVAMVTSSKNGSEVLRRAGLDDLFEVRVDGVVAAELGLKGKPDPDIFVKAAEMLGVEVSGSVVVEDAVSGVQAGQRGRFGLVIGIDRGGNREALEQNGADLVLEDMGEMTIEQIGERLGAPR
jgi:beta-phosphoglucomutase family hydrolase